MQLANISESVSITSLQIAEMTEKNHSDVCRDIRNMLEGLEIGESKFASSYTTAQGKEVKQYILDKKHAICLASGYNVKLRMQIIEYVEKLESASTPRTFAEALRLAADREEQLQIAIATKAEIGTRREAQAMNTASQAVKKVSKLERELDRSRDYATVKRMSMIYHGQKFNWRELKSVSNELDLPPIEVFDANYGTVKAYHSDVWMDAYALEINTDQDVA